MNSDIAHTHTHTHTHAHTHTRTIYLYLSVSVSVSLSLSLSLSPYSYQFATCCSALWISDHTWKDGMADVTNHLIAGRTTHGASLRRGRICICLRPNPAVAFKAERLTEQSHRDGETIAYCRHNQLPVAEKVYARTRWFGGSSRTLYMHVCMYVCYSKWFRR
jgi:hypothetical protein